MTPPTIAQQLVWQQFCDLLGSDLRVGVQTVLEISDEIDDERYHAHQMIRPFEAGGIQHVFHPFLRTDSDLRIKEEMQIVIVPQIDVSGCRYHQFVLSRTSGDVKTPWAVTARFPTEIHPEWRVFGFSATDSRNDFYLNLALPGEVMDQSGRRIFVPLYIKLERRSEDNFTYIMVYAEEQKLEATEGEHIFWMVAAKTVLENDVPEILKRANPSAYRKR